MLAEAFLVATGSSWWSSPAPAGQRSRHHPPIPQTAGQSSSSSPTWSHHPTTNICLPCCNCCTSVFHSTILSVLLAVFFYILNPRHLHLHKHDQSSRCTFPFYLSRRQAVTDPEKRQVSGADITLGQVSAWQVTKPWPI